MMTTLRFGKKWTIPELIALEREYELLELTIQEIAERHQRSESAIVARLAYEIPFKNNKTHKQFKY